MQEILRILNGNVPGGIYLLLLVLSVYFIVNLYLLKVSPLFDKRKFVKWVISGFLFFILIYAVIWRINPPVLPKTRVVIGPVFGDTEYKTLGYSEFLREHFPYRKNKSVYLMDWSWFYPSCNDKARTGKLDQWVSFIRKMKPKIWIWGEIKDEKNGKYIYYYYKNMQKKDSLVIYLGDAYMTAFRHWLKKNKIDLQTRIPKLFIPDAYAMMGAIIQWYYLGQYETIQKKFKENRILNITDHYMLWVFKCLAESNLAFQLKQKSPAKNPMEMKKTEWEKKFIRSRTDLIQYTRKGNENVFVLLALAKSFLLEEKFGFADAFLKQALTLTPNHFKIYYLMSFLHPSRLQEIGFKNELEVLERAYYMNPIDEETVVRYAHYLFDTKRPFSGRKQKAIQLLRKYLDLNPTSLKAMKKIAYFYMYQHQIAEALKIYKRMEQLAPNDKDIQFNKAIAYMENGENEKAISIFDELKDQPGYEDAYAYLGKIYKDQGNYQKALDAFRKRVRMKKSDDDQVALECMKGIRETLQEMQEKGVSDGKNTP
jgi:tetratricopeptide (TPR) repeat protein